MSESMTDEVRRIVAEEEALLAGVHLALAEALKAVRTADTAGLRAQLEELREEAATAPEKELPTLFTDMLYVRALMERRTGGALPEASTPYFAHLRLRTKDGARDYLLGRATYANTAANVRIVDWRYAPIARLFYRYQEGDEFEETLPGGPIEGVVEARRVVVIEQGRLVRIVASHQTLARNADGTWRAETLGAALGGGAGTAARPGFLGVGVSRRGRADITSLLDAEQFDALSQDADRGLLVLGSAGSGKTTVALHRLSKVSFDDPKRFPPAKLGVIVPEEGLARLSRRLLDPLGLDKVKVETFGRWLQRAAMAAFQVRSLKVWEDPPGLVVRLKRHPALLEELVRAVPHKDAASLPLNKLRQRLGEAFTDRVFLQAVIDASDGDIPKPAIEATVRHTMLQLATPDARDGGGNIETVDGLGVGEGTPDDLAGTLDLEDLSILLFLKARAGGLNPEWFAHLVIDEAEDFSLFELWVLGSHLHDPPSLTLSGDEVQETSSSFAGWPEMLSAAGIPDAAVCRLQVSYRCPKPIAELAHAVLGPLAPKEPAHAGRDGAPVGFHHFRDEPQAALFIAEALRELVDREPEASVGVIAGSDEAARALHAVLDELPNARLVLRGDFDFEPGVDVTDVGSVKGLEFDYVIIPDANAMTYPATDESRRRLHVALTRASHQLWVVSSGVRSRLLPAP